MRQFAQRVNLVHKLGKLGRTEEFADNRLHGLRVYKRAGREGGQFAVHTVAGGLSHLGKADADLVFQQFTNTAHAAVAQVVNIVNFKGKIRAVFLLYVFAGVQGKQIFNRYNDIFRR